MTGFLVINHYLRNEKFNILHNHLKNSAKKLGINLIIKTNLEMIFEQESSDFVLFWDKDINLAKSMENRGIRVFNSSESIALCDDKAKTYLALENKIKQPKTITAPLSFFDSDYTEFAQKSSEILKFPIIFKECCGSFGEQVYRCDSINDILSHINSKPFLLQEYIECNNEDVRIEVVGGEIVSAIKRRNKTDFRSNITNGGTAEKYTPTKTECDIALSSCRELGLNFGGVDIMHGDTLCEVNSNAHIINIMNTTGVDIAPYIFKEIQKQL